MNIEQWGLIGVFIAGAIPWFEAIGVVPAGILLGLDPVATVAAAVVGNTLTIILFAFSGSQIRTWLLNRRRARGKLDEPARLVRAQRAFDRWGIYGLAALGPLLIGTQFAAVVAVAAGVKPLKTSLIITSATVIWACIIAAAIVAIGIDEFALLTEGM